MQTVDETNQDRRRFLGTATMAVAATQLGMINPAAAQRTEARMPAIKPGTNTSFGPLKQINAGVLNVGYAEAGPADGPVVILMHGWPYDIHSFVDVAPMLAGAGFRVIIPYLRGYGTTRFLSSAAVRNRSAIGARRRSQGLSGCSQDREADPRRFRLGSAQRQHLRGALAGALQGHGVG